MMVVHLPPSAPALTETTSNTGSSISRRFVGDRKVDGAAQRSIP